MKIIEIATKILASVAISSCLLLLAGGLVSLGVAVVEDIWGI